MRFARALLLCGIVQLFAVPSLRAQHALPLALRRPLSSVSRRYLPPVPRHSLPAPRRPTQAALGVRGGSGLPGPQDFQQYIHDGNLRLSVENAIRLALANNTDVHLDREPIETARDAVERSLAPFDPSANSSFNDDRYSTPQYTQLGGAPTLSTLTQDTSLGYSQTFETGTNVQVGLSADKLSSNSSFNFFDPSVSADLSLGFSQPLLRGRGLFANRAPIVIAQRNVDEARDNFEAEVNDIIQTVVTDYWSVVEARENLAVQKKSLAEARQSYQRDERELRLGALSPLDIYSSQSQMAQVRVVVIQARYALLQAEDTFRNAIGADLSPRLRAIALNLTDKPAPAGPLMAISASDALAKALQNRPEIASAREALMNDRTSIRLDHNQLLPNLTLTGMFQSNGLGGDEINNTAIPPVIISTGGFGSALDQVFGFGYPVYGMGLQLTFPIRNRAAKANLGDALVARRRDLYSERRIRQTITLNVTNSVHQLQEAKLAMQAAKISYGLAEKNLQAQQRKLELGGGEIQFVLQAQTALAQAEQSVVSAEVGYRLAVTAVEHATGGLLTRFHVRIADLAH